MENLPTHLVLVAYPFPPCFFSIFAQVSFSATVRLNTGLPGLESAIDAEVSQSLELIAGARLRIRQRRLQLRVGNHFQRVRIQVAVNPGPLPRRRDLPW